MATKRVSVSGLPQLTNADLKNNPSDSTRTSFLVSSRRQVGGINTSYQLDYAQLYTAISSQIASQFNIATTLGANNKPIYLTGQKFTASTQNIGSDGQYPVALRGGEFKTLPAIGTDVQPVYVNSSGRLTSSAGNVGSTTKPIYMSAGKLQVSNANVGGNTSTTDYGITFTPIYMKAGQLIAADGNVGGCSYNGHTCTPIYMAGGALRPATSPIGSPTRPIYMDRGTLKESSATLGSPTKLMYMEGGVFKEGNEIVTFPDTSMTGPGVAFDLIASVVFTTATNLGAENNIAGDDNYVNVNENDYWQEEFRLLRADKNPYGNWPISFCCPTTGWYTIIAEGASKPFGVLFYNGGWYHTANVAGVEVSEPNFIYYNQSTNNMFTYTGYFTENTCIGIVSNVKKTDTPNTESNAYKMKFKTRLDRVPADRKSGGMYTYNGRTSFSIKEITKGCPFSTRESIYNNHQYVQVYTNTRKQVVNRYYYPMPVKVKYSTMAWGNEQWGNWDSIRLYLIRS